MRQNPDRGGLEFAETIGAFAVEPDAVAISFADPMVVGIEIARPDSAIGRPVYKVEHGGARRTATCIGYGGRIRLAREDDSADQFRDVLEIQFDDGGSDPVADGEAGSLIVDDRGAALGLMIAGDRKGCYLAPLHTFMARTTFEVIRHTSLSNLKPGLDAQEELLADALAGAQKIRSEISTGPDPQNEAVPQRYIDLLPKVA
jgi:hypothetical protein